MSSDGCGILNYIEPFCAGPQCCISRQNGAARQHEHGVQAPNNLSYACKPLAALSSASACLSTVLNVLLMTERQPCTCQEAHRWQPAVSPPSRQCLAGWVLAPYSKPLLRNPSTCAGTLIEDAQNAEEIAAAGGTAVPSSQISSIVTNFLGTMCVCTGIPARGRPRTGRSAARRGGRP